MKGFFGFFGNFSTFATSLAIPYTIVYTKCLFKFFGKIWYNLDFLVKFINTTIITIMGKLGLYEYPTISIQEAITILRLIKDNKIQDINLLAQRLGHATAKSGRFRAKLASLRQYGLIMGKNVRFNISPLGEEILRNPDKSLICRAISNVKLFVDLYQEIGEKASKEEIKKGLEKITKTEVKDWIVNEIIRPYRDAIPYLQEIKEKKIKPLGLLEVFDLGNVKIVDNSTFRIALQYMEILGRKFNVDISLDPIQKILLHLLSGNKTFSQLEERTALSKSNLKILLYMLEKVGFIKKLERGEEKVYQITEKGKDNLLLLLQP